MHDFLIEESLENKLCKIFKKDKKLYDSTLTKFEDILNSDNISHYKNLRKPMQRFKRVHVKGPFVLIFKFCEERNLVTFFDLDHHDKIYS